MYLVERKPGQPDHSCNGIVKEWWFSALTVPLDYQRVFYRITVARPSVRHVK